MNAARQVVRRMLAGRGFREKGPVSVYAPANIALVKYWGKRDEALNLPVTGSLSISLGPLGSHVELARGADAADAVWLNGKPLSVESVTQRIASKNSKLEHYNHSCKKTWLIIIQNSFLMSSQYDAQSAYRALHHHYVSLFDKVFVFERGESLVTELPLIHPGAE